MLEVSISESGEVLLKGRFDAAQAPKAKEAFDKIQESCTVNFGELEYISSAGLGVLLGAQKRLSETGKSLKLINMNKHIQDVFRYAGFDTVFEIE